MKDQFEPLALKLTSFCQKQLGFKRPPKLFLKQDEDNASNSLGRTGQYDPEAQQITIYTSGRHIKDVLRSLAHELIHHHQNLRGDLTKDKCGAMSANYAQDNKHMRNMEKEAYLIGNMIFRDWEDSCKKKTLEENKKVNKSNLITKNRLKKIINAILNEKKGLPPWLKKDSGEDENEEAGSCGVKHGSTSHSQWCEHNTNDPHCNKNPEDDDDKVKKENMDPGMAYKRDRPSVPGLRPEFEEEEEGFDDEGFLPDGPKFPEPEGENGWPGIIPDDFPEFPEDEAGPGNPWPPEGEGEDPDPRMPWPPEGEEEFSPWEEEDDEEPIVPLQEGDYDCGCTDLNGTPEKENNLYAVRFRNRDSLLFETLTKKWTK